MDMHKPAPVHRIGLAYLTLLGTMVALQYALSFVCTHFLPALTELDVYPWLLSLLPLYAVGMPLCLWILPPCPADPAQKQPFPPSHWMMALLLSLGMMYGGNLIGNGLMALVSAVTGREILNPLTEMMLEANPLWSGIATVIVAPLGEEFLFRRLLIDRLRRFGDKTAILLSALLFGAFHLNFYQFFYAFLIGLVFGYVYIKSGRLRYTVALHAVINFLGGVAAPLLARALLHLTEQMISGGFPTDTLQILLILGAAVLYILYALMLLGCFIATIVIAVTHRNRIYLAPGSDSRKLWLSPASIMLFLFCAVIMILSVFS